MLPTDLEQLIRSRHCRYLLHTAPLVLLELLLKHHHLYIRLETLLSLLYHTWTVRIHHEVLPVIRTIPMSIHAADAETIVDGLATLGEVIVGDGVLVTELFLGLLDLAALLNIGKLVLFRLGLAGTDASVLGRHVWSMLDVGLIGVWLGGDGDIIVGVVIAQAVAGCDGERVRFSGVVCADAVRSVLGVGVGEVVAGNNRHGLLLLLELNLQLIQFVELLLRKGLLRSLRLTTMPGA